MYNNYRALIAGITHQFISGVDSVSIFVYFIDNTTDNLIVGVVVPLSNSDLAAGTAGAALRSHASAAINQFCDDNSIAHPQSVDCLFDQETVPVSRITGLATVASSGDYDDLINQPTIPNTTRTTSSLSLSLVGTGATGTQISSTKDSTVRLTVSTSTTATIGGPSTSLVTLKMCSTNDSTEANWTSVGTVESDQTITLAVVLQSVQVVKGQITADIPAGYYVKLVNSGTGTHSEAFISGQKTIYG